MSVGRLAYKYARLLALREARARGEPIPERAVFRELAREFPGCLAELDTLPLDALTARAEATRAAAATGVAPPWMTWMIEHHALYRAALFIKARMRSRARGDVDPARAEELARLASAHAEITVDAGFAARVADPPAGRVARVVLEEAARRAGVTPAALKAALLPSARR